MPLVYCDQNFVVSAHDAAESYRTKLRSLSASATITFVLSPWHWKEMAEDRMQTRGVSMADFCDSLHSLWLYDRIAIQRKEVSSSLFKFLGIQAEVPSMVGDVRDVFHDLLGKWVDRSSRSVVAYLRQNTAAKQLMEKVLDREYENNQRNIADFQAKKLTPELLKQAERKYIELLLPPVTPMGIEIDYRIKQTFLGGISIPDHPAIAIELEVMKDRWNLGRQLKANDALDQQHTMALPYVDFLVTDDKKLRKIIERVVTAVPFRTARVMGKEQFDVQFL